MTTSHHGSGLPVALATSNSLTSDGFSGPEPLDADWQDDLKRIEYSRLDRDYSAWYAGEFIGAYPNHLAAERALDDHALYLAEQGVTVLARPAEVVEPVYVDPARALVAQKRDEAGAYDAPLLLTCASCGATKPLKDFEHVDQEIVCDACLAANARAGDGPATIAATDLAEPASPASAATIAAPAFVRAVRHDLRPPLDALDRDAWRCPEAHIFWVENGYIPLECPRCDLLAAVYAGEDRARVTVQRDVLAHFWIDRYADDPAACLEALQRYGAGHQRAVTAAIAAYFGEAIEAVEWVWTATRRRIVALS